MLKDFVVYTKSKGFVRDLVVVVVAETLLAMYAPALLIATVVLGTIYLAVKA